MSLLRMRPASRFQSSATIVICRMGMKDTLTYHILYCSALAKRTREADVGPLQEGRAACFIQREQPPHLSVQALIGKRIGGKLVAKEAPDNLFGKNDGIKCNEIPLLFLTTATLLNIGLFLDSEGNLL
jgi:hypothetical protein